MTRSLIAVVAGTGRVVAGHLWLILVAAVVPAVLACVTSVILVLSVERSKRVEAIKALPPVVAALNQTAIGRLRAMERGRKDGMPDGVI
jgi:hypothetical protein